MLADRFVESLNSAEGTAKHYSARARERRPCLPVARKRLRAEEPPVVGRSLDDSEREHTLATFERCGGDEKQAAEIPGVSLKTLYDRLSLYART